MDNATTATTITTTTILASDNNDSPYVVYDYLNDAQYIAVFVVGILSSLLSIFGSSSIIHLVLKDNHVNLNELYHRLLLGLSVMDLIVTISLFVTPFTLPAITNLMFANGDTISCEITAFFLQFIMGSYIYNAELSIYFLLTVKYGLKENDIASKLEPWIHIIPVVVPLITGAVGIATDVFNPGVLLMLCDSEPFPGNCHGNNMVDCIRGTIPDFALSAVKLSVMIVCTVVGVGSTWRIYLTIHHRAHQTRRFTFDGAMTETQRRRLQQVGTQAIFYTFAFLIGVVVVFPALIVDATYVYQLPNSNALVGNHAIFALVLLSWLLYPLQGFYNQLIYVRPRLIQWKNAHPEKSWLWSYGQVLQGKKAPVLRNVRNYNSRSSNNNNQNGGGAAGAAPPGTHPSVRGGRVWSRTVSFPANLISAALSSVTGAGTGAGPATTSRRNNNDINPSSNADTNIGNDDNNNNNSPTMAPQPLSIRSQSSPVLFNSSSRKQHYLPNSNDNGGDG